MKTSVVIPPVVIPPVGRPRPVKLPAVAERILANGLRVIVARRAGIPRFEARLYVGTVRNHRAVPTALMGVLTETVLSGTPSRTAVVIAEDLQRMGAGLGAGADPDQFYLSGSALSSSRLDYLALVSEVLTTAEYPAVEVALQRERVEHELAIALSEPSVLARNALLRRTYGSHPYGRGTPEPENVAKVTAAALRKTHATRIRPDDAIFVLVGDLDLARTLDEVGVAFEGWSPGGATAPLRPPPAPAPGPITLVDRPGAVQTNVRLAGPAVSRTHPDYPALALANVVFGGYFTSRLVDNIRERRGYTYSPGSSVEHRRASSRFGVSADVGTEVTAAALVEIRYELGRMVSLPVEQAELDAGRRYLQGTLAMAIQTQAGLTSYLGTLAIAGLDVSYLRDFPAALERVTIDDVRAAARQWLAPAGLVTVCVGDAAAIQPSLEALDAVEREA